MARRWKAVVAVSLLACGARSAWADEKSDVESLRKVVEDQQRQIDELRRQLAGAGSQATELRSAVDDLAKQAESAGLVQWKEVTRGRSKFTLYGFLRLDAQYDRARMNSAQLPAWVRSDDDAAPASIGAPHHSHDFDMHPKLTRLGLDFDGPVVAPLGDAKVAGKLEVDFYNATSTDSRAALRLRHGYLKLTWCDELSVLLGQTQDVISPLTPAVNNDFVMWGAGNLGDRRPQARLEWAPSIGEGTKLILQGMVGDTGAVDGKDLDPAGTTGAGFLDGQTSGRPTWQGRAAVRFRNWDDKDVEVGLWGHLATEEPDADVAGHGTFRSSAVGLDARVPLAGDWLWIQGEWWTGRDLTDVRGGILQGVNTTTGEEIRSSGGFAEVGVKALPWLTLYGGWSTDDPENHDLSEGGLTGGRSRNEVWYAAGRMNFDPVEVGLEYLHWKTEFIGFDDGVNDRFVAFVAYRF